MTLRGYSIRLSTAAGDPLAYGLAARALSLSYGRTVNDVGSLALVLPGTYQLPDSALPDGRIEVWRRLPNGREYLDTETIWQLQTAEYREDARGERVLILEADTPLALLRWRFVYAVAGSAEATKSGPADDVIKAVVREQVAAPTNLGGLRVVPGMSVAPNTAQAPTVEKAFAWRRVLDVCQDLAAAAAEAGTYLAFDLVSPTPDTLQFQTFTGVRGTDRRFPGGVAPVILSPETRTLLQPSIRYDFRDEVTYALAGGAGEGAARLLSDAIDNARVSASPYRYRERFVDARSTDVSNALTDEARAAVRQGRPRVIIEGRIAQTRDLQYGVHWAWGDYVTVQAFGRQVDARIDALAVEVTPRGETIAAVVRGETYA